MMMTDNDFASRMERIQVFSLWYYVFGWSRNRNALNTPRARHGLEIAGIAAGFVSKGLRT